MPVWYQVTINGVPFRKGLTKRDAEALAEKFQGEKDRRGLLKHGDKGDWVEVKPDHDAGREFDHRYDRYKAGHAQEIVMVGRED